MSFISYCQIHCFKDHVYFKYMASVGCISVANHNRSYEPARSEKCQIEKLSKQRKSILTELWNRLSQDF